MIDFDVTHHFTEIIGKYFLNSSMSDYFIGDAIQLVKFSLDEKGMKLRSEAAMMVSRGISFGVRHLYFNKPFLLYVKEPSGKPYFALWIANTDLLVKK